ncbi:hypothetical protein L7F22_050627 [Adiantum nelumboides]|nr:hypothetical protein [Adiantum nelumboides]
MANNNEEGRIDVDSFDFANEGASEETPMLVNYLITRLQQAMANPALQGEVQQQLQAYGFIPPHQEERIPEKSLGETSKRGTSKVREGENPYEELRNLLLDDAHQSRRRGHAQRQEPPTKEKERSESPDKSMEEDVAPRRRRVQRSPTPTKRKRFPQSPPRRESKKEEKDTKKKKERKRSPSSPSSSSSSSSDESGGSSSRESPRRGHRRSHAAWRRDESSSCLSKALIELILELCNLYSSVAAEVAHKDPGSLLHDFILHIVMGLSSSYSLSYSTGQTNSLHVLGLLLDSYCQYDSVMPPAIRSYPDFLSNLIAGLKLPGDQV